MGNFLTSASPLIIHNSHGCHDVTIVNFKNFLCVCPQLYGWRVKGRQNCCNKSKNAFSEVASHYLQNETYALESLSS